MDYVRQRYTARVPNGSPVLQGNGHAVRSTGQGIIQVHHLLTKGEGQMISDKQLLEQALEALELLTDTEQTFGALDYGDNAITAIRARLDHMEDNLTMVEMPVQEPKHIVHSNGRYSPLLTRMMNNRVESHLKQVIHLYDEPPAAQPAPVQERDWSLLEATQESLREHMAEIKRLTGLVVAQQLTIDKLEAQRQWVGLSDGEIYEMADDGVFLGNVKEICRAIEAKLREKNTP
jgi:hypothetical protein